MSDDIPEVWVKQMERRGIAASYRGLADKADMSHEAVRRVIRGWSVRDSSVRKVAEALGLDFEVVQEWRGFPDAPNPWEPPSASSLLSHDEREALSRLISLMTRDREQVMEHGHGSASKTQGASAPVQTITPIHGRGRTQDTGSSQPHTGSPRGRTQG